MSDATASAAATAAGCNNKIQNSANDFYTFASALPSGSDAVIPISSGSWISQANGLAVDRSDAARAGGADLASIDALGKPYSGSAPSETPRTAYYQSTSYGYNQDAALESLFAGSGSALCSSTEQTIVNQFGFDSLTAGEGTCGSTTETGNG